jgi:hypothetical protein
MRPTSRTEGSSKPSDPRVPMIDPRQMVEDSFVFTNYLVWHHYYPRLPILRGQRSDKPRRCSQGTRHRFNSDDGAQYRASPQG